MPKNKRDRLKGCIATAHLDLQRALVQLADVSEEFKDVHPELDNGLVMSAKLIIQAQAMLEAFYIAAWGELPVNWITTRNRK